MINALQSLIKKNDGSISIEQFMQFALYHKDYGYYMKKVPIGSQGDFVTAPEISQLFAETIAIWIILQWEKLSKPKKFSLVELGPGRGTMMSDILRITQKYFLDCVDIYLMEISPLLKKVQKEALKQYKINWCDHLTDLPNQSTIFIANEFFDAIPIRQYIYQQGWYERRVNENLQFILEPTNDFSYAEQLVGGSVIEVSSISNSIFDHIGNHLERNGGSALIIDYGYLNKPYKSTLQAVKNHQYHDILSHIGEVDITAHVDFSMFINCQISTQANFLHTYGIRERAAKLLQKANYQQSKEIMVSLRRLTSLQAMGELFKVAYI